ncbi:MAG: sulfurtransferase [Pseudomonadales bacterium]|nr:sulfurtransferase [Pseudomonadales bacterium]
MLPLIAEPAELIPLLGHDKLLIIDLCRQENFNRAHIPGAVHVEPAELVSGTKPATGKLPDSERLHALFSRIGYTPDLHILAYDDEGGGWAGRFIWTLDVIGHSQASALNGGLLAWVDARGPLSNELTGREPTNPVLTIDRSVIAEKEDVLASLNDENTVIWDARSAEEYAGIRRVSDRAGHIPGAINLDWQLAMDQNRQLRIRADIADVLNQLGITPDKKVITHCQSHHRSGLTYLIGKSLGYDIRGYHGSWSEWGNDPDTPVEI